MDGKLKRYVKNISKILDKFIDTYQGKVDLNFWNKIVHEEGTGGSGKKGPDIDGWIIQFFGYEKKTDDVVLPEISVGIKVTVGDVSRMVKMKGGFKAVSKEGHVFRPHLSLAILDEETSK